MSGTPDDTAHQPSLILDATILSNFGLVGQLRLVERLYAGRVATTLNVVEEIRQGIDAGYAGLRAVDEILTPFRSAGWLPILIPELGREQALFIRLISLLGSGEASCLAIAESRGMTLATDDLAARRTAGELGVSLTGTLGILVRSVREGHLPLSDANDILRQMVQLGYRSPVHDLDGLV